MEELRYIMKYLHGLFAHTEETWQHLSEPDVKEADLSYLTRCYYYPLMGVGTLLIFLLHGNGILLHKQPFDAPFNFEFAMKGAISFALSYVLAPSLAVLIIRQLFCRLTRVKIEKQTLEVFAYYATSVVMVLTLFISCFPNFTFLSFIILYAINIVYQGTDPFLKVSVNRGYFITIASAAIIFSPWIIKYVLAIFVK